MPAGHCHTPHNAKLPHSPCTSTRKRVETIRFTKLSPTLPKRKGLGTSEERHFMRFGYRSQAQAARQSRCGTFASAPSHSPGSVGADGCKRTQPYGGSPHRTVVKITVQKGGLTRRASITDSETRLVHKLVTQQEIHPFHSAFSSISSSSSNNSLVRLKPSFRKFASEGIPSVMGRRDISPCPN